MKKYIVLGAFILALSLPVLTPTKAHAYQNIISDIKKIKDTAEATVNGVKSTVDGIRDAVDSGIDGYRNGIKSEIPYL